MICLEIFEQTCLIQAERRRQTNMSPNTHIAPTVSVIYTEVLHLQHNSIKFWVKKIEKRYSVLDFRFHYFKIYVESKPAMEITPIDCKWKDDIPPIL